MLKFNSKFVNAILLQAMQVENSAPYLSSYLYKLSTLPFRSVIHFNRILKYIRLFIHIRRRPRFAPPPCIVSFAQVLLTIKSSDLGTTDGQAHVT